MFHDTISRRFSCIISVRIDRLKNHPKIFQAEKPPQDISGGNYKTTYLNQIIYDSRHPSIQKILNLKDSQLNKTKSANHFWRDSWKSLRKFTIRTAQLSDTPR